MSRTFAHADTHSRTADERADRISATRRRDHQPIRRTSTRAAAIAAALAEYGEL